MSVSFAKALRMIFGTCSMVKQPFCPDLSTALQFPLPCHFHCPALFTALPCLLLCPFYCPALLAALICLLPCPVHCPDLCSCMTASCCLVHNNTRPLHCRPESLAWIRVSTHLFLADNCMLKGEQLKALNTVTCMRPLHNAALVCVPCRMVWLHVCMFRWAWCCASFCLMGLLSYAAIATKKNQYNDDSHQYSCSA